MSKVKVLKVATIKEDTDSSTEHVAFKSVGFVPIEEDENGVVLMSNMQPRIRNVWAERPLANGDAIKADPLFSQVKVGSLVAGEIVTLATTPYALVGGDGVTRTVHQWSGVIFSGENAKTVANRSLKANNATVIEIDNEGIVREPEMPVTAGLETSGLPSNKD